MAWDDGMFKGWGRGGWDVGNIGDFGGADYIKALREGGTSNIKELRETRDAVRRWMDTNPQGYGDWKGKSAFQGPIKDLVTGGTKLGDTRWGDYKSDSEAGRWYTEADWLAGQSMGQSSKDIQRWLMGEGRSKIKQGSDILRKVTDRADEEWESEMNKGFKERTDKIVASATADAKKGMVPEADLTAVQSAWDLDKLTSASNYKTLSDTLGGQIKSLKDKITLSEQEAAKTKFSGPVAVGGPGSAMGIRAAGAGRKKTGFRGTLSGLTRQQAPAQPLKVQTLNL